MNHECQDCGLPCTCEHDVCPGCWPSKVVKVDHGDWGLTREEIEAIDEDEYE